MVHPSVVPVGQILYPIPGARGGHRAAGSRSSSSSEELTPLDRSRRRETWASGWCEDTPRWETEIRRRSGPTVEQGLRADEDIRDGGAQHHSREDSNADSNPREGRHARHGSRSRRRNTQKEGRDRRSAIRGRRRAHRPLPSSSSSSDWEKSEADGSPRGKRRTGRRKWALCVFKQLERCQQFKRFGLRRGSQEMATRLAKLPRRERVGDQRRERVRRAHRADEKGDSPDRDFDRVGHAFGESIAGFQADVKAPCEQMPPLR